MSWFSELAGKAEAFLERVDQATATTLQNVQSTSEDTSGNNENGMDSHIGELQRINTIAPKERHHMDSTRSSSMSDLQSMVKTQPKVPRDLATVGHSSPVKYFTPGSSKQRSAPPNDATPLKDDDNWLEYLNTPTKSDKKITSTPTATKHDDTVIEDNGILNKEVPTITISDDDTDTGDVVAHTDHMPDQQVEQESVLQDKLSNMELENTLLRGEVKLLNTELAKAKQKMKEIQESTAKHQHDAMLAKEQLQEKEQLLRQLRGRDEDLSASVATKTSQLAAIKALLEETQSALEQEREKSRSTMVEKERLVEDASQSSGLQAQAMDSLQERLRQFQSTIDQERAAAVHAKNEHSHKERQLTQQLHVTMDTLHKTEAQVKQLQVKCSEHIDSLRACQTELETSRQQHLDYKQRATSILQAKEKLITNLQEGQSGGGGVSEAILEQNKMEKRMIEQQLSNAEQQLEQLRTELSELEGSSSAQLDHVSSQLKESEEALNRETHQHNETKALLSHAKEELSRCNEEMVQHKVTSSIQLKDKEQDIQALQEKIAAISRSPTHTEQVELETRLQELTESLIEKQTTLETLHSERNSLQLQLDKAKSQLAEMEESHKNIITHHNAVSISGLDGSAVPQLHPIRVADTRSMKSQLSHGVHKAATSLDAISIKLGVFLRRYPYARLFVLGYVLLLHLWVMIILLTYSPEVHPVDQFSHQ